MSIEFLQTKGLERDIMAAKNGAEVVLYANKNVLRVLLYDPDCDLFDIWAYMSVELAAGEIFPDSIIKVKNIAYYRHDPIGLASFTEDDDKANLIYDMLTRETATFNEVVRSMSIIRGMLSENKLPVLLEATACDKPGILIDSTGIIVYANYPAIVLWGVCQNEAVGQHISNFDTNLDELGLDWDEKFNDLCEAGESVITTRHKTPDGPVDGHMTAIVVQYHGELYVLSVLDIATEVYVDQTT